MKLLCIGDLHIQKKNLCVFKEFEKQLYIWLETNAKLLDGIVILGDVLHTMDVINTLSLNTALVFFSKLKVYNIQIYVLVGNHDFIGPNEFMSKNHWMSNICTHPNIKVIDYATVIDNDIIMCPYVPPGRFIEALSLADKNYMKKKIIFCHQEFKGVQFESVDITSDKGDDWDNTSPLIVSGHIHKKQWLQKNIYYVGTPYQTRFNEDLNKSIVIIDVRTKEIQDVYLNVPKLISITESIENVDEITNMKLDVESNMYKILLESPSIVYTNSFIKKNIYKRLKGLKNVTILFVYPKSDTPYINYETIDKPLEFKKLLYENIKHNQNMINMYNMHIQHDL